MRHPAVVVRVTCATVIIAALSGGALLARSSPGAAAASTTSPLALTPYMGWNTYYGLGANFDEAVILATVDRLVTSGLREAGYEYVWLDMGWWPGTRNAQGAITVSSTQWPHGMAYVADYIHRAGMKAGIYTDAGLSGCGGVGQGSRGHYQQDMDTFAAWGYDAVKVDWCGGRGSLDPRTTYADVSHAVRHNSSGRPMLLNICNFIELNDSWEFGPYTGQSWRTNWDIGHPGHSGWGGGVLGFLGNFDVNSRHPGSNGPGHWNDPDYLMTGVPGLTDVEVRAQFTLWAVMASPLIIGGDVRTLSPAHLDLLKNPEVIAVDQDPLGVQAIKAAEPQSGLQVWSKVLSTPGRRAVALFNRTGVSAAITVTAADVGLIGPFTVRDLWARADRGVHASYTVTVPSHGASLLELANGVEHNQLTLAINAGGAAQGDFRADTNVYDGGTGAVSNAIDTSGVVNPAPMAVYQTARGGINGSPLQYYVGNLSVGGTYRVRLHFAENWQVGDGARRFNVRINGSPVLTNFDIYSAAGHRVHAAVVREFDTVASQGFVSIDFSKGASSDAIVSGIEVIAAGFVSTPPDTGTPPPVVPSTAVNLARGAVASASSEWDQSYAAARAIDGVSETRWNAAGGTAAGQWLQVDFGTARTVDSTRLVEAFDRIRGYRIQYSTGSTWRDAVASGGRIGSAATDTFQPVRASKIRLLVTATAATAGGDSPSIVEFEVFNVSGADAPAVDDPPPPAPPDTPPAAGSGNLAALPGAVVTASSQWHDDYGAPKAADGSAATRWNSGNSMGAGEWLQIDFGTARTFDTTRLSEAFDRIKSYRIQYGSGATWIDAVSAGGTIGLSKTDAFPAITASTIRLLVTSTMFSAGGGSPSIVEFEVWNSGAPGAPPSQPPPTPSQPLPGPSLPLPSVNLALAPATVASASSQWNDAYGPRRAADDDATTRWNAANGTSRGEWLQLDFGAARRFDRTTIREAFGRITSFKIQYDDGHGWIDVLANGGTIGDSRADVFPAVTASRVRLLVTSTTSSVGADSPTIVEFAVFSAVDASPPPEPTVPSTPPATASSATFAGLDAASAGNWKGQYGSESFWIPYDATLERTGTSMRVAGQQLYTWKEETSDVRALERAGGSGRAAATWYELAFTIQTSFSDGLSHRVALYLVDFDTFDRGQTIDVVDAQTGALLDTRFVAGFHSGHYLRWDVRGDVVFRISCTTGWNAVVSAVFVDPTTAAAGP